MFDTDMITDILCIPSIYAMLDKPATLSVYSAKCVQVWRFLSTLDINECSFAFSAGGRMPRWTQGLSR